MNYTDVVRKYFPLKELEGGRFSTFKLGPMTNHTRHYEAEGFGHICLMESSALFGLMKMTAFNVTPTQVDLPLFSIDIISVMGNTTMIVELYDTFLKKENFHEEKLLEAAKSVEDLPPYETEDRWYTPLKLASSWAKKTKKKDLPRMEEGAVNLLTTYLEEASNMPKLVNGEITIKKELDADFAEKLVENGGVSTDMFIKKIGKDETLAFFHDVFYGV